MISFTIMQVLTDHWDELCGSVVTQIRSDPSMRHMAALSEGELDRRARDLIRHFDSWMKGQDDASDKYEEIARHRFEQGVPLHEIVRALQTAKQKMISFVREQGVDSPVKMYAEEELEHSIDKFFDHVLYHTVRGYEAALHFHAMRISAASR